jgi:hypothetical protein
MQNIESQVNGSNTPEEDRLEITPSIGRANGCLIHILKYGIGRLHEDQKEEVTRVQNFLREIIKTKDLIEKGECPEEKIELFGEFMRYQGHDYGEKTIEEQRVIVNGAIQRIKWCVEDLEELKEESKKFYNSSIRYDRVERICGNMIDFLRNYDS